MSLVHFEGTLCPCVNNEVTSWHAAHGWCYNVYELHEKYYRPIGVFFCTLLCGDGCIIHFDVLPDVALSGAVIYSAFKKALAMVVPVSGVVYATVPARKVKLRRCLFYLGFGLTDGGFDRDGERIELLKYFGRHKDYINHRQL